MRVPKICLYICCGVLVFTSFTACGGGGKDESSSEQESSVLSDSEVASVSVSKGADKASSKLLTFRDVLQSDTFCFSKTVDGSTSYFVKSPDAVYLRTGDLAQLNRGNKSYLIDARSNTAYEYADSSYAIDTESITSIVTGLKTMIDSGSDIIDNEPYTFETYEREYFSEYLNKTVVLNTTYYFDRNDVLRRIKTDNDGSITEVIINTYSDTLSDENNTLLTLKGYTMGKISAERYLQKGS